MAARALGGCDKSTGPRGTSEAQPVIGSRGAPLRTFARWLASQTLLPATAAAGFSRLPGTLEETAVCAPDSSMTPWYSRSEFFERTAFFPPVLNLPLADLSSRKERIDS